MISRLHVTGILLVGVSVLFASQWYTTGARPDWGWLTSVGLAAGAVLAALVAFDQWLWRIPFLQGWFVHRPNLRGDWNGELRSLWTDPSNGERRPPIAAKVVIRQTFSKLHLRLETSESAGDFVACALLRQDDETYRIAALFRNEPRLEARDRSVVHMGTMWLEVVGDPTWPEGLRGTYWTDRGTRGEFHALRATPPRSAMPGE